METGGFGFAISAAIFSSALLMPLRAECIAPLNGDEEGAEVGEGV